MALANVQINLQSAFKNCFSKTRKKKNGFPKFKSAKHSRKAYTTNNQHGTVAIIDNKYIKIPKVGKIKAKIHRMKCDCGIIIDRDQNAAINIIQEGLRLLNESFAAA